MSIPGPKPVMKMESCDQSTRSVCQFGILFTDESRPGAPNFSAPLRGIHRTNRKTTMAKRAQQKSAPAKSAPAKSNEIDSRRVPSQFTDKNGNTYNRFVIATKNPDGAKTKWCYHGFISVRADLTGGMGTLFNAEDSEKDMCDSLDVQVFPFTPKPKTQKDSQSDIPF